MALFKEFLQNLFPSRIGPNEKIGDQDIIFYVIGPSGAGKSTFINTVTKGKEVPVNHQLAPQPGKIQAVRCQHPGDERARNIIFMDIPACNHDMADMIAKWLSRRCVGEVKVAGIIYVHRISDRRIAERPEAYLGTLAASCKKILLVTTMWDLPAVDEETGSRRENKIRNWKAMVDLCTRTFRFKLKANDNAESAWCAIETLLEPE